MLLSPAVVAQIRAALVAALQDSGAEIAPYGPEPGMPADTLAREAQLRDAIPLLDGVSS